MLNCLSKLLIFSHHILPEKPLLHKQLHELLVILTVPKVAIFSWAAVI